MIKTKIVATLGPASSSELMIKALMKAGVGVFRLNFSHGTLEEHSQTLAAINKMRSENASNVAVMGDLCGPKIRTSPIRKEMNVVAGEVVIIEPGKAEGTSRHFGTNYASLAKEIESGHRIMIDDGQIILKVRDVKGSQVLCEVVIGGIIKSRKGMSLPDTPVSVPAITKYDWKCADWAIESELDYLALSFVRKPDEVRQLIEHIAKKESAINIIPKIEKPEAVRQIEDIVRISDAILVARGDMGVEMDLADVPLTQKKITALCRKYGKPVIVATQMLQSMIEVPTPTRAEVSDVANAIIDATDAVMLSGETAIGKYPLDSVRTMRSIARKTEAFCDAHVEIRPPMITEKELEVMSLMARNTAAMIDEMPVKLVVNWSEGGTSARVLSKARMDVPIVAMSSNEKICRQMSLFYGVIPIRHDKPADLHGFVQLTDELLKQRGWAVPGDQIILLPGKGLMGEGIQHTMLLHTVG